MILNCVLCGNEVERGGYSSKVNAILLQPLCESCNHICFSNPGIIVRGYPWLFNPNIPKSTPLVTAAVNEVGLAMTPQFSDPIPHARELLTRYKDAYLVAKATVGFGGLIKGIGVVLAILIALAAITMAIQTNGEIAFIPLLMGAGTASFVGVLIYLLGILVSAQGQILKASLDSAVNTSPFLSNAQRANIMSLPDSDR